MLQHHFACQIPHLCIPADTGPSATDVYFEEIVPKQGPFKIYVTNLPYKIVDQDVIDFFESEHSVKLQQVHFVMKEGKMTGQGFLHMPSRESMIKVLKMDAFSFKGRNCKVAVAESRGRGGGGGGGSKRDGRQHSRGGGSEQRGSQRGSAFGGRRGGDRKEYDGRRRGGERDSGAFGAFGSKRKEDVDTAALADMPPPAGPKRASTGTTDPAILDKYSMKSGVMTVGEDGRPRLNLAPRTAPLPDIAVTPMEDAPARSSKPSRSRGNRNTTRPKGDGWHDATHHTGGRRNQKRGGGVVSAAAAAAEAGVGQQEVVVAKGSNTAFDALYSDSDSE